MSKVESARAIFKSYLAQDRNAADRLLADEFVFTSPQDDHIDKEYELKTGERHRNVELLTVRDDRITETQVFFGGRVR